LSEPNAGDAHAVSAWSTPCVNNRHGIERSLAGHFQARIGNIVDILLYFQAASLVALRSWRTVAVDRVGLAEAFRRCLRLRDTSLFLLRSGEAILRFSRVPGVRRNAAMADGSVFARVHVLILCDDVEEFSNGEELFDLRGVRTQVSASSFPYVHPQLCIYLQITGHAGIASGRIVVVHEASDEESFQVPIEEFQLSGPLDVIPMWVRISDCEFPEPGVYWFEVFLNEKLVSERRFRVIASSGEHNGQSTH
jgi:hypothetical protein